MNIEELLVTQDLDKSLLIGYYGGGNFGDELLLEVFENLFFQRGIRELTIAYQPLKRYKTYHHDFGYSRINMGDKKSLLFAILKHRSIVIGGGGLWGVDMNLNVFILSLSLFTSRWLFRKKIYLLGVGYYDSTTTLGRMGAWLAGKSASYIVARDSETQRNFRKISKHVGLDHDVAWYIPKINVESYRQDQKYLTKTIPVRQKTLFITLRRFKSSLKNNYSEIVSEFIADNQDKSIIVALMEPRDVDPEGYRLIQSWATKYKNVQSIDFSYNPLALYDFFQTNNRELALIAPQFHAIIMAHLTDVPFLPVAYDNKVVELLKHTVSKKVLHIKKLRLTDLLEFADSFYGG